jgi:hypothetical protein
MTRREWLRWSVLSSVAMISRPGLLADEATRDWRDRWSRHLLAEARDRSCDRELGEELGWIVSPVLNGFHYGFLATQDPQWMERLIEWTNARVKRAVREPDGFPGWPKGDGGGGPAAGYHADSLLGEAMMLRPALLAAANTRRQASAPEAWRQWAKTITQFSETIFAKWDSREAWRPTAEGGVWVVPEFGIDSKTGGWSAGYESRKANGFSNPANKQNHIARWLLALHAATGKAIYRDRAEAWFRVMKSRMRTRGDGRFLVWNYWDPAGPWDRKPDGSLMHWVGVHPNGGYYAIDLEGIVDAFKAGLVFTRADLDRLIATNRDFMWNQKETGAAFQRIDGGDVDARWKNSPGLLWEALLPYDATLRRVFVANHRPDSWGGLASTPWFLAGMP